MKSSLFATLATAALLTATSAFATPFQGPGDNYGYAKGHRVTSQERARWDNDHKNDRRDNDHKNDKFDRNKNYGFDKNHRVTSQERARWEAQHKHDRRDNDHR
ncbi:MAG: hypothetical protein ACRYG7_19420 [Janthinobacterium lividum]